MPRAPTARASADIQPFVADDERARRIEVQISDGAIDEPRAGLRQSHAPRVGRDPAIGVVRTIVIRVDARATRGEPALRWRCVSSTNASVKSPRAIPDWFVTTTTGKAGAIEGTDRIDGPREERDI